MTSARWQLVTSRAIVALTGLVVLGWATNAYVLTSFSETLPRMSPATATLFLLLGLSLGLRSRGGPRALRAARALTALVALTAASYLALGLSGRLGAAIYEGMRAATHSSVAPATALAFLLSSSALTLPERVPPRWPQNLALGALTIGVLGLMRPLHQGALLGFRDLSVPTALAHILVALGALTARGDAPLIRLLRSDDGGGVLARRLIPAVLASPALMGWFVSLSPLDVATDLTVLAIANAIVLTALIKWTIYALRRGEADRRALERRFASVVDSAPTGILLLDAGDRIVLANRAMATLLQRPHEDLLGEPLQALLAASPGGEPAARVELDALRAAGPAHSERIYYLRRKDAPPLPVTLAASPLDGDPAATTIVTLADQRERLEAERERRENHERFLMLTKATRDSVWDSHNAEERLWLSDTFQETFGWTTPERFDRGWLRSLIHPDDQASVAAEYAKAEASGADTWSWEYRFRCVDGTYRCVKSRVLIVRDARGAMCRTIGTLTDVSDAKLAERLLHERAAELESLTAELARSNTDLERFAQVASHDLQEPLRTISSFLQLLSKRYAGQLDETGQRYIGYAVGGADRMRGLIDALLTYSRIDRRDSVAVTEVALEHILESIQSDLRVAIQQCGAVITHDPLPTVKGHEGQLSQLLLNLVSNALKYRRADTPPHIHISCEETPRTWTFSVRDNGIGIEPQYHERIFVVFQRLHTRDAYEGTGVGLAICKRVVERHGGKIWVESTPSQGSTFFFTLARSLERRRGARGSPCQPAVVSPSASQELVDPAPLTTGPIAIVDPDPDTPAPSAPS